MAEPADFVDDPLDIARIDALVEMRALCADGKWQSGASRLQQIIGESEKITSAVAAQQRVEKHFRYLLDQNRYLEAGTVAYHRGMFEARPLHVRRLFHTLTHYDLVMLVGAGDLGKSLNASVFASLYWIHDPDYTLIKFASVTDTNLKSNVWSKMLRYQDQCLFPVGHDQNETRMRIWKEGIKDRPEAGIDAVLIGRGAEASGRLKGSHPQPFRDKEHPVWGWLTRVLLLLDEGQHLPDGVEKDLGSPMTSVDTDKHVMKIIITANLTDELKWAVKKAAPKDGWREEFMDTHYDWTTSMGWRVCRVDTAVTENIKERREVFPGFPKYGGDKAFMNGSIPTADFFVMWRGWTVPGRSADVVIPSQWFDQSVGEPVFTGRVHPCAAFDPAYDRDAAVLALGRYGTASGWISWNGDEYRFDSRKTEGEKETRHCLVLDQLILLQSKDPVALAREIRAWCEKWNVTPEFTVGDRTGNGVGTTGHLDSYWGKVVSINWSQKATPMHILAEHRDGASDHAPDIIGEMFLTLRSWIPQDVRGFFINPLCPHRDRLKAELTTRQWARDAGNRFCVETKEKFMKRGNPSPGFADATAMLSYAPRIRGLTLPALTDETVVKRGRRTATGEHRQDQTSEVRVTLSTGGRWEQPQLNGGQTVTLPAHLKLGR